MHPDPIRRDLLARDAGSAHADACVSTTEVAKRWKRTTRAVRYWNEGGHPAQRAFMVYLLKCDDPWQVVADVQRWAKLAVVARLSTPELISRYREILATDKRQEAEETVLDLDPRASWAEVVRAHRVDAGYDTELAAIASELEARRVSRLEVLHG